MPNTILIGAPIDEGQRRPGCVMGPTAYRVAGLAHAIRELGHGVEDWGDLVLPELKDVSCPNPAVHMLPQVLGWTEALADKVDDALSMDGLPIILGGDHSLALGSVAGAAAFAARADRPLFLLWLDAHSDFHTPLTTTSGNLHGTPVAYIAGREGFEAFPPFPAVIPAERICLYGIRSVDPAEHAALLKHETLTADEVHRLMRGERLTKPTVSELLASEARKNAREDAADKGGVDIYPDLPPGALPRPA